MRRGDAAQSSHSVCVVRVLRWSVDRVEGECANGAEINWGTSEMMEAKHARRSYVVPLSEWNEQRHTANALREEINLMFFFRRNRKRPSAYREFYVRGAHYAVHTAAFMAQR